MRSAIARTICMYEHVDGLEWLDEFNDPFDDDDDEEEDEDDPFFNEDDEELEPALS